MTVTFRHNCPSVRLSVFMCQLDAQGMAYSGFRYKIYFRKTVQEIQVSLKPNKKNGCFSP